MHRKDSAYLVARGYIKTVKDTLNLEDEDTNDALEKLEIPRKDKAGNFPLAPPVNDSNHITPEAILPGDKKKPSTMDTVNNNNQ
jgi:hypothetical protein